MNLQVAKQLSVYLQNAGAGVINESLFTGILPEGPAEAILLDEPGGETPILDISEANRGVSINVRSASRAKAYERIWALVRLLTAPEAGVITVGGRSYTVKTVALPARQCDDARGRYVMSCRVSVCEVTEVFEEWLEVLAGFTESTLGSGWRIYRGFQGSCRPSVSWQCTGRELTAAVGMVSRLVKRFTARLCAEDADSYQQAVDALMIALANQIKFATADESMVLSISGISETRDGNGQATGELTLALTGQVPRALPAAPYMPGVRFQPPFAFAR